MCAREMNSEVATTGPCAEEAYWYGRCQKSTDVDVSLFFFFRNFKLKLNLILI